MSGSHWLAALALVAAVALMAESVRQLRRRWLLVTVEGDSMSPALSDGDELLAKRTRRIAAGQIVVAAAPDPELGWAEARKPPRHGPWWVKRVAAGPGETVPGGDLTVPEGHYFLLGDNPAGEDSRRHGPCPAALVVGTMVRRF